MQFTFQTSDNGLIKPIENIPDIAACLIEGRNGVGKSLAVRLLELATGTQGYGSTPSAWKSLKQGLGPTVIRASGLAGGEDVEWLLRPEMWPELPFPVDQSWLGEIRVNGQPTDLSSLRRLIRVHRVAGDETLMRTIAHRIREDLGAARRVRGQVEARQDALDGRLSDIAERIGSVAPRGLLEDHESLGVRTERLRQLDLELPRLRQRHDLLDSARSARLALQRIEAEEPELRALMAEQTELETAAAAEIDRLLNEQTDLVAQATEAAQLKSRLEDAERELTRLMSRADDARIRAARATSLAGAPADLPAVTIARDAAKAEVVALGREVDRLGAAPAVHSLYDAIETALSTALASGLGWVGVARLESGEELSAEQLRSAVGRQRAYRRRLLAEDAEADLRERLGAAQAKVHVLETLMRNIRAIDAADRAASRQAAMVADLRIQLRPDLAHRYREWESQLADVRQRHLSAAVRRSELAGQIDRLSGGRQIADIRKGFQADLKEAAVDEVDLDSAWSDSVAEYERARTDRDQLRVVAAEQDERLRAGLEAARNLVVRLNSDGATEWLTNTGLLSTRGEAEVETAQELVRLAEIIDRARDLLREAGAKIASLEDPLSDMASSVEQDRPAETYKRLPGYVSLYGRLVSRYEHEFTERFRGREITDALFDGGEFVGLSLRDMSVSWKTPRGEQRSRPLEAFSSGERAFAYTLARLESIADEPTENRMVALDEFGAFVARDRLGHLVRFLRDRILGSVAQQVLVILPLTQDYSSEAKLASGDLQTRLARRADDVRTRDYFAESFEDES